MALCSENGRVLAFDPDVLLLVGHAVDFSRLADYVHVQLIRGNIPGDDFVHERVRAAGITADMSNAEVQRLMKPYAPDITGWAMRRIIELCREHGIRPVFALIPMPQDGVLMEDAPVLLELAQSAGFDVIDLSDVYSGHDQRALVVAEWDRHPNADGHRLIAERLFDELADRGILNAPSAKAPPRP